MTTNELIWGEMTCMRHRKKLTGSNEFATAIVVSVNEVENAGHATDALGLEIFWRIFLAVR